MITNTTAKMTYTFTEGITEYAVGFVYQTNPDGSPQIKVYINDAVNTPLVYGTDYTMSLDGTKVVIASGAEVGDLLTIIRNIPIVQLSDYVVGRIDPEQIENDFDLCVERDQQQSARITVTEEQLAAHDERISDIEEVIPESAATDNLLATVADIPTVNDTTITFTQGGTTKGTITLNQASAATIEFDAGGGGGSGAVDSVNGYTGVVVLAASDVGALPDSTTIPDAQIQSDWGQSDNTKVDYIKNKPTIPTVNDSTITFTQGGVTKGTLTTNQASAGTIALDAVDGGAQSIDAEIYGSVTVSGNDISNFSTGDYVRIPGVFQFKDASSFEIVGAFTTNANSGSQMILCPTNGWLVYMMSGIRIMNSLTDGQQLLHVTIWPDKTTTLTSQSFRGTTNLAANTKYYIKLTYDGTDYKLYLSTDGVNYALEASDTATYLPETNTNGYYVGPRPDSTGTMIAILHMDTWSIKKDAVTVWAGVDAPGLHQRAESSHEIIAFQAPSSTNDYTWYRKYADGWVEQGGYTSMADTGATIALPITMSDTNYVLFVFQEKNADGQNVPGITAKTTSSFSINPASSANGSWQVSGMAQG